MKYRLLFDDHGKLWAINAESGAHHEVKPVDGDMVELPAGTYDQANMIAAFNQWHDPERYSGLKAFGVISPDEEVDADGKPAPLGFVIAYRKAE